MARSPERILICRTDSIGDVMLTLPLAGLLKKRFPGVHISFLGRSYTAPVLKCCSSIDEIITYEELQSNNATNAVGRLQQMRIDTAIHVFPDKQVASWVKASGIPTRIGTSHRWWHWLTANERVSFSRRNSDLHEAQLNVELLAPLGISELPSLGELAELTRFSSPDKDTYVTKLIAPKKKIVILHPRSKGSAAEWGLDRFSALIEQLDPANNDVIVTGTQAEAESYKAGLPLHLPHVTDTGGTLNLDQLIALIGSAHALVAASTGPLHIAAAIGVHAIGLYPIQRPMHPGRWAPLGKNVTVVTAANGGNSAVDQVRAISVGQVLDAIG